MTTMTEPTPYEALGGEAGIKRPVHRFYELMDELPEAYGVRQIHPATFAQMADHMINTDSSQGCQHGVS